MKGLHGLPFPRQVAGDHLAQQVLGHALDACVVEHQPLGKLALAFCGPAYRLDAETLPQAGAGGHDLRAREDAARLVLPAAAGCHHLLQARHLIGQGDIA